jgi:hypothetical protein
MDGRISIAMNIYGDICSVHKPGGAELAPDLFMDLFQLCQIKANQMTRTIRKLVKYRATSDFRLLQAQGSVKLLLQEKQFLRGSVEFQQPSAQSADPHMSKIPENTQIPEKEEPNRAGPSRDIEVEDVKNCLNNNENQ